MNKALNLLIEEQLKVSIAKTAKINNQNDWLMVAVIPIVTFAIIVISSIFLRYFFIG